MEYMLIFHEAESDFRKREDAKAQPAYFGAWAAYVGAMHGSGIVKSGNGLQGPQTSTTVRLREGKRLVQDGPFADTREQLGGYFIVDVDSLDVALEWAARAPCAATGATEVRPVMPPMPAAASQ